jgi:hypothetical protein
LVVNKRCASGGFGIDETQLCTGDAADFLILVLALQLPDGSRSPPPERSRQPGALVDRDIIRNGGNSHLSAVSADELNQRELPDT